MLENIINIGQALKDSGEEKTVAELWIKDNKPMDLVLVIDIKDNEELDFYVKEFEDNAYIQSLFYQQGNDLRKGSGITIHNTKKLFDEKNLSEIKSLQRKLKYSLEFLELNEEKFFEKCKQIILDEVSKDISKKYLVMFTKNKKTPYELYREKFENQIKKLWKTNEKLSNSVTETTCQSCNKRGKGYDTAIFKCYNNDKEAYSNIYNDIGENVFAYNLCEDCIRVLLNGKQYISDNMSIKWLDSDVMFIPHELTPLTRQVYETGLSSSKEIGDSDYASDVLLKSMYKNECNVFEEISKVDTMTDIIFYKAKNSEWKIIYSIQGVMPSRFGQFGKVLSKYEQVINHNNKKEYLYLGEMLEYIPGENSSGEKIKIIDLLLHGRKYSKSIFYHSVLSKYKEVYIESLKDDKQYLRQVAIRKINKIYNIFAELGCFDNTLEIVKELEGGGYKMIKYKNREELFDKNKDFFDSDVKKAWFMLGELYNKAIYESKKYYKNKDDDKKNNKISHLESGFIFYQKFDYSTFIKIANKCKEQFIKYKKSNAYTSIFNEMRELISNNPKKITQDEAKYIFFWGMESFFTDYTKKNKEDEDNVISTGEDVNSIEDTNSIRVSSYRLKKDITDSFKKKIMEMEE